MQNDPKLAQILVLKELVLSNLNLQMIPLELEIKGTPLIQAERLVKLETELELVQNEFKLLYDQLWSTCQSQGFYVETTKSFAFGVLHEIKFDILPIPAGGKYPKSYALVSDKEF